VPSVRTTAGGRSTDSDDLDAWSSLRANDDDWETADTDVDLTEATQSHAVIGSTEPDDFAMSSEPVRTEVRTDERAGAPEVLPSTPADYGYDDDIAVIDEGEPEELFADRASGTGAPLQLRRPEMMTNDDDEFAPAEVEAEPRSAGRNLPVAIGVGLGFIAVAAIAFSLGPAYAMALVTVILGVCAIEFFNATFQAGYQPATLLGLMATVTLPLAAYWRGMSAYPVVLFLSVVCGLLWYLFGISDDRPVHNLGVTLLGVFYIGGLGSFAALMLSTDIRAISTVLSVVALTVAYDTGGYAIGRSFGRTPLTETSPNKTWEGLVGGVLVAVMMSIIVVGVFGVGVFGDSIPNAILLGIVVAIAGALGDLSESLIKRDLDLKDMSEWLPGHGGFLDRFDAMLFVLPAAYYLGVILDLFPG
jgi:phosphatidate cytidylyltransferase